MRRPLPRCSKPQSGPSRTGDRRPLGARCGGRCRHQHPRRLQPVRVEGGAGCGAGRTSIRCARQRSCAPASHRRSHRRPSRAGLTFRRFAIDHPSLFAIGVQRTEGLPDESWNAPNAARIAALSVLEDRLARLRSARPLGERNVRSMAIHFHAYCEGMAALEIRWGVPMDNATMERLWVDGLTAILHGFQTSTTSDTILAAVAGDTLAPD